MPDLKPGTLCWLTHCQRKDEGKIVEVKYFDFTHPKLGDIYEVYSKTGVTIGRCVGFNPVTGRRMMDAATIRETLEFRASRSQLIPINDPDLPQELDTQYIEDQLKSLPLKQL